MYAGFSATVSIRALIIRLPIEGSLAHDGTRPQRQHAQLALRRLAASSASRGDGERSMTAYTGLVGATL